VTTNFSHDLVQCFRLLDPRIDQRLYYDDEERGKVTEKLFFYMGKRCERRGDECPKPKIAQQLGRFIIRRDVASMETNPLDYWATQATVWPELADYALVLMSTAISEAAVERAFSAQGRTYHALRERMREDTTTAEVWIQLNHELVADPAAARARAKANERARVRRREIAQNKIDELWAKRRRL